MFSQRPTFRDLSSIGGREELFISEIPAKLIETLLDKTSSWVDTSVVVAVATRTDRGGRELILMIRQQTREEVVLWRRCSGAVT